jgi:hypothetical protein
MRAFLPLGAAHAHAKKNFSAEQSKKGQDSWLQGENADQGRPGRLGAPPGQGPQETNRKLRESCSLRQVTRSKALRQTRFFPKRPGFAGARISKESMPRAFGFRARFSPGFVSGRRGRRGAGWDSQFPRRWAAALSATVSSVDCARPSVRTSANSGHSGTWSSR